MGFQRKQVAVHVNILQPTVSNRRIEAARSRVHERLWLAWDLLPNMQTMILPEAVLTVINTAYAVAGGKLDREPVSIALAAMLRGAYRRKIGKRAKY